MATVKPATEDDWDEVRLLRLSALADSPSTFASSLEEEEGFSEADWRGWARCGSVFIALADGAPVGMVAALDGDSPRERKLIALWVHPEHRARGVASSLISYVEGWARQDGAERLTLWVAQDNDSARSLYQALGFERSGKRRPLRSTPGVEELQMLLWLR